MCNSSATQHNLVAECESEDTILVTVYKINGQSLSKDIYKYKLPGVPDFCPGQNLDPKTCLSLINEFPEVIPPDFEYGFTCMKFIKRVTKDTGNNCLDLDLVIVRYGAQIENHLDHSDFSTAIFSLPNGDFMQLLLYHLPYEDRYDSLTSMPQRPFFKEITLKVTENMQEGLDFMVNQGGIVITDETLAELGYLYLDAELGNCNIKTAVHRIAEIFGISTEYILCFTNSARIVKH